MMSQVMSTAIVWLPILQAEVNSHYYIDNRVNSTYGNSVAVILPKIETNGSRVNLTTTMNIYANIHLNILAGGSGKIAGCISGGGTTFSNTTDFTTVMYQTANKLNMKIECISYKGEVSSLNSFYKNDLWAVG